eukprot:CAMPEP_0197002616 /NCGR_PEP_ID=MMETSP1380-20130617/7078_1 /TAXON_ID=5936 /ORGANISM="Euplotes crassus, Strain CT5" /LENGTH=709 /DNA_ID=CAMNT_0042420825 /DNA_START=145 /DNA_END=2271 /DNA_ORIENTATION=-
MYSGRFLNDLGEFENCTEHEFSRFMLSQIELNITGKKDMSFLNKDTARFVQGLCVPKECSDTDSRILRDSFFLQDINFTRDSNVVDITFFDVEKEAQQTSKNLSSTSSVMIVVFVFLVLLGLLGLLVENTSLGNKPNLNQEEEENNIWDKYYDQEGLSADEDQKDNMCTEFQDFLQQEKRLIMSKNLWGIILLSFSFKRNARRLFKFSVIRRMHVKTTMIEGLRVMFLIWVIIGNTFLFSFYSYPANFTKIGDISSNYLFITLLNNELSFDSLLFIIAFLSAYDLLEKFDDRDTKSRSYILYALHFIIKMLFPVIIIIGISSIFKLFSSGPLWGTMTEEIISSCDRYLWTHVLMISNLVPFGNNIGNNACLPWLWFVSTEFQFFFFCLFLTILYTKRSFLACLISWVICLFSLLSVSVIAGVGAITTLSQYDSNTYEILFTKPWTRIFGYSLGLFVGFIFYEFNKESKSEKEKRFGWRLVSILENMNINKRTILIIFAFALIIIPSIFQWLIIARETLTNDMSGSAKTMYILYLTLGRPIYFTGLVIIILFCLLNKLKWITIIVGNYSWGPMTELSYSAYLMHFFIIVWYYSSLSQTLFINIPDLLFTGVAVIVTSFLVAIPFSFLIEIPSKNLMELILFTMKRYRRSSIEEEKEGKAGNSSSREKIGFNVSNSGIKENNVSNASANLMFLSGAIPDVGENKKKKLKID